MLKLVALASLLAMLAVAPAWADGKTVRFTCPKEPPPNSIAVQCPKTYPGTSAKLKTFHVHFDDHRHGDSACERHRKGLIISFDGPTFGLVEMQCRYTNGKALFVALPMGNDKGKNNICWLRFDPAGGTDQIGLRGESICYFQRSGNPDADKVVFHDVKPLDRTFTLFGIKLGMTEAEVEDALKAEGAEVLTVEPASVSALLDHNIHMTVTLSPQAGTIEVTAEIHFDLEAAKRLNWEQAWGEGSENRKRSTPFLELFKSFKQTLGLPYVPSVGGEPVSWVYWGKPRYDADNDYSHDDALVDPQSAVRLEVSYINVNTEEPPYRFFQPKAQRITLTDMTFVKDTPKP